jgi:hypothetical protein
VPPRPAQTTSYKTVCDNHPDRRAAYAYRESKSGEDVGMCQECFDRKRRIVLKKIRINKVRSRRK